MDEENKMSNDELKSAINETLEKVRTHAMLTGARSMTVVIANMIDAEMNKPGKRTNNDLKRVIKQVRQFCQTAIEHEVEKPKFGSDGNEEKA